MLIHAYLPLATCECTIPYQPSKFSGRARVSVGLSHTMDFTSDMIVNPVSSWLGLVVVSRYIKCIELTFTVYENFKELLAKLPKDSYSLLWLRSSRDCVMDNKLELLQQNRI